jgi:hypothetical protein
MIVIVLLRGSISRANTIGDSAGDENLYQVQMSRFGSANIQHIDFQEASQSNRVAALVLFLIVEVDS